MTYLYLEEVLWRTIYFFEALLPGIWHCLHHGRIRRGG